MSRLPTGTVTFLFTDIEGSTRLLRETGSGYADLLGQHSRIMRDAIGNAGGVEVNTEGDSFFAVFRSALEAVSAVVNAQRSLTAGTWPSTSTVRVRMGLHTGLGVHGGDDYIGLDVHLAARVAGSGHGGQVLLSHATARLIERSLPAGVTLKDLGEHRLKDIPQPERLFQLAITGLPDEFPPLRTLEVPSNLPDEATPFVGRVREQDMAVDLLERSRLVTLTGPGGTGKTRLALAVARRVTERFPDGVFFVPLESIREAVDIPSQVADAVGLAAGEDTTGTVAALASSLGDRALLLVLDNLEQIRDPAQIVADILASARNVTVLATSRLPLHASGELELPVPPMTVPRIDGHPSLDDLGRVDSVVLFVQRATATRPDFQLTEENGTDVAALCARLQGVPLAIEIAAARVKALTPRLILDRLGGLLDASGARDRPVRQQTLRNTISWSYDLLEEELTTLLQQMSVFSGGVGIAELEAVCCPRPGFDPVEGAAALVDHSLVTQTIDAGHPRFHMLEMIREFASDRLETGSLGEETHRRHAEAYLQLAEEAAGHFTGPDAQLWLNHVAVEHHNFEAAVDWSLDNGEGALALRLVAALWRYWQMRGHLLGARARIDAALGLDTDASDLRARALEAGGGVAYWLGDAVGTRNYYEQALDHWRTRNDEREVANALFNLSYPLWFDQAEGPDAAAVVLEDALSIFESLGDTRGVGRVSRMLGMVEAARGNNEAWAAHARRAIANLDPAVHPFDHGWALFQLSGANLVLGDPEAAEESLRLGLEIFAAGGDVSAIMMFLTGLAQVAHIRGDAARSALLAGAVGRLRDETGTQELAIAAGAYWLETRVLDTVSAVDPAEFERGRDLSTEDALAVALQG